MNDGTMPTQDPAVMPDNGATPPVDGGMGAPAMDPPATTPPTDDGGMGAAPAMDPPPAPAVDGGDMGAAPEAPAAEGEEKPVEDAPAPM